MKDTKSVEKLNLIKKLSDNSSNFKIRCELMYQNLTTILYRFNDGASLEDFIEVYYKDNQVVKGILDNIYNTMNEIDNLDKYDRREKFKQSSKIDEEYMEWLHK